MDLKINIFKPLRRSDKKQSVKSTAFELKVNLKGVILF